MNAKIQRWGNSLALRLPKAIAEEADLSEGKEVVVETGDRGGLVIRPARPPRYTLGSLLRRVRRSNLHGPIDTGPPVGKELL